MRRDKKSHSGGEKLRKRQNTRAHQREVTREPSEPRVLVSALAEHAVLDSRALTLSPLVHGCASAFVSTRLTVPRSRLSLAPGFEDFMRRTLGAACGEGGGGGIREGMRSELALGQQGKFVTYRLLPACMQSSEICNLP
ncbi:hypothetical protein L226DRAFT_541083 [Lentinus tigrinus ALCF2SS1-7]|uniref:uncharacterized protein n=1 Tax=Lentinus tigrinus ALCF2SS1-7 TaxID=1328758 RepID=UPI001166354C|nr:hypothetical protein L226DRAFT_541190 [Lentinus tigrinus ALCF2SS1-7]RPD68007.1 hypothetical protein L226DRAFT_541083 [Lentinus tigrinus ALCF2SS1-7]